MTEIRRALSDQAVFLRNVCSMMSAINNGVEFGMHERYALEVAWMLSRKEGAQDPLPAADRALVFTLAAHFDHETAASATAHKATFCRAVETASKIPMMSVKPLKITDGAAGGADVAMRVVLPATFCSNGKHVCEPGHPNFLLGSVGRGSWKAKVVNELVYNWKGLRATADSLHVGMPFATTIASKSDFEKLWAIDAGEAPAAGSAGGGGSGGVLHSKSASEKLLMVGALVLLAVGLTAFVRKRAQDAQHAYSRAATK